MPKTDIVSAQWLAEQMLRVAKSEPNQQSVLNRGVDRKELVSYVDAVSRFVNAERSADGGQDASMQASPQGVEMMT